MPNIAQDKAEKFKIFAQKRTNEVLKKLKILGNCSNRRAYSYTAEDVDKIFRAIDKKIKEVRLRFIGIHDDNSFIL